MLTPETVQPVDIADVIDGSPYQSYTYSYPHKTAYRLLEQPIPLNEVWASENQSALFLYLHVPFCEHRCGFCNLFTQANPEDGLTQRYLRQLQNEAQHARDALAADAQFAQLAIGGGTPTFLDEGELEQLLRLCTELGADGNAMPVSVEVSPPTVTTEKLKLLSDFGTDRISMGIQSFNETEAKRLGRPQKTTDVVTALEAIRMANFPILNIDLIYGGEGQSVDQWMACVKEAVRWKPEELYLYPLYVRALTGLGRLDRQWDDQRLEAYTEARSLLLSEGYRQTSMRMFQWPHPAEAVRQPSDSAVYRCQDDGMVGLGCGARSYTRALHYSTEYAVGRRGVHSILLDYLNRPTESFAAARYGNLLPTEDRRRRFAILSLLQSNGIARREYEFEFGDDVLQHIPELSVVQQHNLAVIDDDRIQLTSDGMARSDAIGPWLYSERVRKLMQDYELI